MNENTPQVATVETTPTASDRFHAVKMRIAKRIEGKNTFVKFLTYGLPTLDMVIDGVPAPDSWNEETLKEGDIEEVLKSPSYANEQLDYLQQALLQRVQGIARTRDSSGMDVATNWSELLETTGGVKYPVQLKQFKDGLAEYLVNDEENGLSAKQVASILIYTDTRRLQECEEHRKERVAHWFSKYIESLAEEAKGEIKSVIANLERALAYTPEELDF